MAEVVVLLRVGDKRTSVLVAVAHGKPKNLRAISLRSDP
jgi:hypothetical protein